MRCLSSFAKLFAVVSLVAMTGSVAHAQAYLPSEADIDALVETDFSSGASTTTLNSIDTSGPGIGLDVSWDDAGEGFARVVLQRENFNADLSAFSSFDLVFQADDPGVGVKTFVQTGDGFSFNESAFENIAPGSPQTVSLDLSGVPDTDNIRQFGFQMFGPTGETTTVGVFGAFVPEPTTLALMVAGCATLLGYRRRNLA